jgi:heme-degrading monooxygenase HmoA
MPSPTTATNGPYLAFRRGTDRDLTAAGRPDTRAATTSSREADVIARMWRGAVRNEDADEYAVYIEDTGMAAYRSTPGNRGAWILRREVGDLTQFITLSMWDDMDAVRAFAGDDPDRAVMYDDDEKFLVEHSDVVEHYRVD